MNHELIEPTVELKAEFLALAEESRDDGDARYDDAIADFDFYVQTLLRNRFDKYIPEDRVPQTTFWLVSKERRVLGTAAMRHRLMPQLEKEGNKNPWN